MFRSRSRGDSSTEWKVSYKPFFDQAFAEKLAEQDIEVLVINLPEPSREAPEAPPQGHVESVTGTDPRQGADAKDVLSVYFGQWHIEGLFAE